MGSIVGWLIFIVCAGLGIGILKVCLVSNLKTTIKKSVGEIPDFNPDHQYLGSNGLTGISLDTERRVLCLTTSANPPRHRMLGFRDILSAEIIQDGHSVTKTSRTSQAGAALLGGVLFGGVGAVVGALSGKTTTRGKTRSIDLQIIVNDPSEPNFLVNFQHTEAASDGLVTKMALKQCREWLARITVLIRLADEADGESRTTLSITSVADELTKLLALRDRGLLSDGEFNTQRERLLAGPARS